MEFSEEWAPGRAGLGGGIIIGDAEDMVLCIDGSV